MLRATEAELFQDDKGALRPEDPVTREEAVSILANALAVQGRGAAIFRIIVLLDCFTIIIYTRNTR